MFQYKFEMPLSQLFQQWLVFIGETLQHMKSSCWVDPYTTLRYCALFLYTLHLLLLLVTVTVSLNSIWHTGRFSSTNPGPRLAIGCCPSILTKHTVKLQIFVRYLFSYFRLETDSYVLIFALSRVCEENDVEIQWLKKAKRNLHTILNFVLFQKYEMYENKYRTKICDFTVITSLLKIRWNMFSSISQCARKWLWSCWGPGHKVASTNFCRRPPTADCDTCEEAVHLVNSTIVVQVDGMWLCGVPRHIHSSLSLSLDGPGILPQIVADRWYKMSRHFKSLILLQPYIWPSDR